MSDSPFAFELRRCCPHSAARTGIFTTPHGPVSTPAFMPVGTLGTVKGVQPRDLRAAGSTMILANTYHLHLRPGEETVARLGGLHRFMNWDGPILTDSGGYQVFSMGNIRRIDEEGVTFRSIVDGRSVHLTPERTVDIQRALGADVVMAFDHCPSNPLARDEVAQATERTSRWLARCVARWRELGGIESGQALAGIVQGGAFEDLRQASVAALLEHDLALHAIGGVSVGEDREAKRTAVGAATALLPQDRPRYLMGVGTPLDFFDAVEAGIDLFDCVTPTRHGRNHQAYTSMGLMNLRNSGWKDDPRPLDPAGDHPPLAGYSRGVLRHLCVTNEMLAGVLLSLHNLHVFHDLLARMRAAIEDGTLPELRARVVELMSRKVRPGDLS